MCACPATYYLFYVRNGDILVFSDHGIDLCSINLIECTSGFYIRARVVIIYFYIRYYHVCISDSVYSFYYQV